MPKKTTIEAMTLSEVIVAMTRSEITVADAIKQKNRILAAEKAIEDARNTETQKNPIKKTKRPPIEPVAGEVFTPPSSEKPIKGTTKPK